MDTMQARMMPTLPLETIEDLYPRYAEVWDVLLVEASARHLLTLEEFREEMLDPRLEKYVVSDQAGRVVAMTTLTADLDAIPWINPKLYQHRFPAQYADGTLFYLGYTFVDVYHRRSGALALMAEAVNERLALAHGVIGFDICAWAVERGIGRHLERMFSGSTDVIRQDTQTYFVADYRHAHPAIPASDYTVSSLAERPDLAEDVRSLLAGQWPAWALIGGAGHGVELESLLLDLPDYQLLVLDQGELCGAGLSLPLSWDGDPDTLPSGWDDAIVSGQAHLRRSGQPDTVCVLSTTVSPSKSRRGLAGKVINALKQRAADTGAGAMIAPVRPTSKPAYPLIPIAEYATWTTSDGQVFDPWLRLHLRLGAEILKIAPESMVVTGTVAEWESWLDVPLPGSGDYIIDGGLAPLRVDRNADSGRYVEPNIWMSYRIAS